MKKFYFIFFISICITSCYSPRYVYSPSTQNIPLLNKKNDLQFAGFYAGSINAFKEKGNYNRGFDIDAAWAVTNHFGIIINESVRWEKNGGNDSFFPYDTSFLSYKRNFTEVGAGYFSSGKKNLELQFQIFGGAAFGSSKIFDDFTTNSVHEMKYHYSGVTKLFVQPVLIYKPLKNFSVALSSRVTEVIFKNIRTNYSLIELGDYLLDSITVSPSFFWEPAVSYTFGFKKFPLKFELQGSITVLLNHRFIEHRNSNLAIGIIYRLISKKQEKKTVPNKEHL